MAIKIEIPNETKNYLRNSTYAGTGIRFAYSSLLSDGKIKMLGDFIGCRDAFMGYIADHFHKPESGKMKGLSTRKTAVIVKVSPGDPPKSNPYPWFRESYDNWLRAGVKAGVKILNHFEKESKWAISKSYDIDVEEDLKACMQFVQGSRWWISSPYTMSLFLLILRSACRYEEIYKLGQAKNLTTKKIMKAFKSLDDDYLYKKDDIWKWPVLLKYRRELFRNCTTAENYKSAHKHGVDGIKRFTDGSLVNEELQIRFNKLCEKHKLG